MLTRALHLTAHEGGRAVSWANAWLLGMASLDEADLAASRSATAGAAHRVVEVPGENGPVPWSITWGRMRAAGVERFTLALPVPGDPLGLLGPAAFNAAAVASGVAVIATGRDVCFGVVPDAGSRDVPAWQVAALPVPPPESGLLQLSEVRREFDDVVRGAAAELGAMDLARDHPGAAAAAERSEQDLHAGPLSPVLSGPAVRLLNSAARLNTLVSLALSDDGAAVTSGEARRRHEVLERVERVSRRALVAAYSSIPTH